MKNFILLFVLTVLSISCTEKTQQKIRVDPEFESYISAYTTGIINKNSPIQVQLKEEYKGSIDYTKPIEEQIFSFVPAVEGEAYWVNRNTIEFRPSDQFTSGQDYEVHVNLDKIIEVEEEYEDFGFNFKTISLIGNVYIDGITTPNPESFQSQEIKGRLVLSDLADTNKIKKTLNAFQNGQEKNIVWEFSGGLEHKFYVVNVKRSDAESVVKLEYDGTILGVSDKFTEEVTVAALGDFYVKDVRVIHEPEQYVEIEFSDPLLNGQNLSGLVSVQSASKPSYLIDNHLIKIYYSKRLSGLKNVSVYPGIQNIAGKKIKDKKTIELVFEGLKPQIKLLNNGVIAPFTPNGVQFPFEAVNLKAVDIFVTKIYENNIIQFLQVNNLEGSNELKRLSKQVYTKTLSLNPNGETNLHKWNKYFIDLSEIVNDDKGAIYRVELRFKKEFSVYGCEGETTGNNELAKEDEYIPDTEWSEKGWSSYDYWYDYDYYDDYDYDWKERKNPCNNAYYRNKSISSNILASNIGLTAKAGGDKVLHIAVNNLLTAEPIAGAEVEFYSFTQQLLGSVKTDANGMCELYTDEKPFVVIAKHQDQRGYIKLRDGEALSLSKFEVGGSYVQRGVKGMMYADRGVWRPGDSIYSTFILEDKADVIPSNHPVTFQVYNPQNQLVHNHTRISAMNGVYDFRWSTNAEAPTGNYYGTVSIGNRTFSKVFKIETVKPNRLKIYLDFKNDVITSYNNNNKGDLKVQWLHGADAGNLKARVSMTMNKKRTTFKGYDYYDFDDEYKKFKTEEQVVFDQELDEKGEATVIPNIYTNNNPPGLLTANFVTKVFEKGGDFSIDRSSFTYSPYESYVGINTPKGDKYSNALHTDESHTFNLINVHPDASVKNSNELEVAVYRIEWKWWWDSYGNSIANYIAKSTTVPVFQQKIKTVNGKGAFDFKVAKPDWGRYFVRVTDPASGHSTGKVVYFDWPYENRYNRTNSENATMLSIISNKEKYTLNEEVKLTFPAPEKGRALITIESGTKVLQKFSVPTTKGNSSFTFKTNEEMAPNVYASITLLQPHGNTENDVPIRLYGVVPIMVENPKTHLNPEIVTKDNWRPKTDVDITISERDGKPMTYTLAVVDDGLLDLTSFKTPTPWNHFYAKEALGVKTWDVYDNVMGAFGTDMQKLLATGGDGSAEVKKPNKANRFKPMVRYIGPFYLAANENKTHNIDVPNYIGSVRVMVVAAQDASYGHAEKTVKVKSPLMVLGTLPRVLSPKEEVYLPVNVFAMDEKIKKVNVEVTSNELVSLTDKAKKEVSFSKTGDKVVNYKLKVNEKMGIAKVHIKVTSGNESAEYDVELDVREPNPPVTDVYEKMIKAGESWDTEVMFTGLKGTNSAVLEVSSFPSINLNKRLKYLVGYPHGCVEQTTSKAFPQLYLAHVMDLDNDWKISINKNVNAAINRLKLFQNHEGGFTYWPGGYGATDWATTYVGHFLLEAEKIGYEVPNSMKKNWVKYQKQKAGEYKLANHYYSGSGKRWADLAQAYRLYSLALANSPDVGAMNRLKESPYLSIVGKWRLAHAYWLIGQKSIATELVNNAPTDIEDYVELSYTYGSDLRDEAMILELLTLMKDERAPGLAKRISEKLNSDRWLSTQTTAFCLISVGKFIGAQKTSDLMEFSIAQKGLEVVSKSTKAPVYNYDIAESENSNITVTNNGEALMYVKLAVTGVPMQSDREQRNNNVRMTVSYLNMDREEIGPDVIEQGTDFIAEVRIYNPGSRGYLREMTLNQMFPSGWEIHNNRMDGFANTLQNSPSDYQDIRDDRVYTYYNLSKGKEAVFQVQLNATYKGKFYLPAVITQAMYDESINARVPGRWVRVIDSNSN